jgi:Ca-activated chloride channel family protein
MKHLQTIALLAAALFFGACDDSGGASDSAGVGSPNQPTGAVGVGQGGAQDFGQFRQILEAGQIPGSSTLDPVGFFAEHKLDYPRPTCDESICIHGLLGVAGNFITGSNCTLVQIGLNSPIDVAELERPPLDLVLAIDVSGSMRGDPIEYVRRGLSRMINALDPADTVTIVTYSDFAQVAIEDGSLADREGLQATIDAISAQGATNIHDGLFNAFQIAEAHQAPGREARVVLLSDGVATSGIRGAARLTAMAEAYARQGIGITTIGVGESFDVELMRAIGEVGAGNFYFLEDAAAVEEVFEEEIATFLVPIALDVEIDVVMGAGYEVRRAYGTNGWRGGLRSGEIRLPSLFLAGRREASEPVEGGRRGGGGGILIEVMPSAELDGIESPERVGRIMLRYTDPESGERREQRVLIDNPNLPGEIPEGGHFTDATVEKGFVMLNLLVGFQLASGLAEDGDPSSAVGVLEALRPQVADWLLAHDNDPDIEDDLKYVDLFISNLRNSNTIVNVNRPPEPWPVD